MNKPRALDLFCGAGGASRGLQLAGFHVTGVDLAPQPRYCGDAFHQADAMTFPLEGYDFIWASPPCQAHTKGKVLRGNYHQDLIPGIRARLVVAGIAYVIENVPGAPLISPVMLCGAMFGLRTYRHRLFEASFPLSPPSHPNHDHPQARMGRPATEGEFIHIVGNFSGVAEAKRAIGIDWMNRYELSQSIPPAYSRYIGEQFISLITAKAGAA